MPIYPLGFRAKYATILIGMPVIGMHVNREFVGEVDHPKLPDRLVISSELDSIMAQ